MIGRRSISVFFTLGVMCAGWGVVDVGFAQDAVHESEWTESEKQPLAEQILGVEAKWKGFINFDNSGLKGLANDLARVPPRVVAEVVLKIVREERVNLTFSLGLLSHLPDDTIRGAEERWEKVILWSADHVHSGIERSMVLSMIRKFWWDPETGTTPEIKRAVRYVLLKGEATASLLRRAVYMPKSGKISTNLDWGRHYEFISDEEYYERLMQMVPFALEDKRRPVFIPVLDRVP